MLHFSWKLVISPNNIVYGGICWKCQLSDIDYGLHLADFFARPNCELVGALRTFGEAPYCIAGRKRL